MKKLSNNSLCVLYDPCGGIFLPQGSQRPQRNHNVRKSEQGLLVRLHFTSTLLFLFISFFVLHSHFSYGGAVENICIPQTTIPLEEQLQKELQTLNIPAHTWLPSTSIADIPNILDVAIIGGGMNGLCTCFALIKEGINNIKVFDENDSGKEGPWARYARMHVLRSEKTCLGPSLGIPSLTFCAWYEIQYGLESWKQLKSVPTNLWNNYLYWFKTVLNLPVENNITLKSIIPVHGILKLILKKEYNEQVVYARKVVLATGRDGAGGFEVPQFMNDIPKYLYAHSAEQIDMASFANKNIAIIGAGASAFDAAAAALEQGAQSVDMIVRREVLPETNKFSPIVHPGAAWGFYHLKDDERWTAFADWLEHGVPPPKDTLERVKHHQNLNIHYNTSIQKIIHNDISATISTNQGDFTVDFIIIATGFAVDLLRRPELAHINKEILLWGAQMPRELANHVKLSKFPYLGPHFEFLEIHPGKAPYLKNIYCFNYGAFLSHGLLCGDIGWNSLGTMRLVEGIVSDFFLESNHSSK